MSEPRCVSGILLLFFVYFCFASHFLLYTYRVPTQGGHIICEYYTGYSLLFIVLMMLLLLKHAVCC